MSASLKVSCKKELAGSKAIPRRSLQKQLRRSLSEIRGLDFLSRKRVLGELVSGGVHPMNGLYLRVLLVFFQLNRVKVPSGLIKGNSEV